MNIYFVSLDKLLSFAAMGFVAGILVAYGAGGLPIDHPWAPVIVVSAVMFFVSFILAVIIITKKGITYLSVGFYDFAFQKTPYEKIRGISLTCKGRVKAVLWPERYDGELIGDNIVFLQIELANERKKRRLPLGLFSSHNRVRIVQMILKQIEKNQKQPMEPMGSE